METKVVYGDLVERFKEMKRVYWYGRGYFGTYIGRP